MILLDNEPVVVSKFISVHKLWEDKFVLEIFYNNKNKNRKLKITTIELTIGDIACFVKPHSDFVCDTIIRGILPKRHYGIESPTVFVLGSHGSIFRTLDTCGASRLCTEPTIQIPWK